MPDSDVGRRLPSSSSSSPSGPEEARTFKGDDTRQREALHHASAQHDWATLDLGQPRNARLPGSAAFGAWATWERFEAAGVQRGAHEMAHLPVRDASCELVFA
jgi:hypothetical protein